MHWKYSKKIVVLVLLALLSACSRGEDQGPVDKVSLQLVWKHQAQFAGFYAADRNGFYQEENIQITMLPRSSPAYDVVGGVARGDADFGISYGVEAIKALDQHMPTKAIASIFQRYPLSIISLKEKGITHPVDFVGRKFRDLTPGAAIVLDVLLTKHNIRKEDIVSVRVGYDFSRFFSGEIDVWTGYSINEVILAKGKGYELNEIRPEDYGVKMFGDILITSNFLINTNPDLVQRFVRATIRGWQWAIENPEEAAKLSLYYDVELDASHQVAMMKAAIPYIQYDQPVGIMAPGVWKEMYDSVREQGLVSRPLRINSIYTNKFVEKVHQEK